MPTSSKRYDIPTIRRPGAGILAISIDLDELSVRNERLKRYNNVLLRVISKQAAEIRALQASEIERASA